MHKVLIAIIGPNWDTKRLNQKADYVRREIEEAKEKGKKVIPLLVSRTTPPRKEEIPESLQFIWDLNFTALSMNEWGRSIEGLRHAVDKAVFN